MWNTSTRRQLVLTTALAIALAACSDDPPDPVDPGPDREYRGSVPTPSTANVNSVAVDVDAIGYDSVTLRIRTAGEPDEFSAPYAFTDDSAHAMALGLLAGHDYEIDVLLKTGTVIDSVDTLEFTTAALPDWLPEISSAGISAEEGYLGLSYPHGPIIVDNQGRVRWYLESPDPVLINFIAHPSGEFTLFGLQDELRLFKVYDEAGQVVRTIGCVDRPTRFHEIRIRPDGDYWLMCDDEEQVDLTARGGGSDVTLVWTVLQHVGADGSLLFEFNTREHFSLDDIDQSRIPGATSLNMTHGNSIAFSADGNVLVSFRALNEITKVNVTTGEVMWRLGGNANQFTITDPGGPFERQHGVRVVGPGVIQFLDNGTSSPSRLVRYEIDEQAMTANLVLEYIHPDDAFTVVGGNTNVLAGGGGLVAFGRSGRVAEVDANGEQTFELTGLEGDYIFRAFRIPSLYDSQRHAE